MTTRPDVWLNGDAYDQYMGRWSARIAPLFLEWLAAPPDRDWLDVGCGTGVLTAAIVSRCAPRRIVGVDTADAFLDTARSRLRERSVDFRSGSATALPLDDGAFDVAVSGLVLNLVGDSGKAVSEMARVVRPRGLVALYVWDFAGQMQILRYLLDAARETDPRASDLEDALEAPICRPAPLRRVLEASGLVGVDVHALDTTAEFADFDDYWAPFLGGTGAAPNYVASRAPDVQASLREELRRRLPTGPDGEILLALRAWAVKGRVADSAIRRPTARSAGGR